MSHSEPPRKPKPFPVAQAAMAIIFLALLTYVSIKFGPTLTRLLRRREDFREFIRSYGAWSALAYIFTQAAQVVIFFIPGEIVQIAGGYIFGTILGTVYSVTGIFLATVIVFFATRLIGYSLVKVVVPSKELEKFAFLANSPKSEIAMFVLFLVPGVPKDVLTY